MTEQNNHTSDSPENWERYGEMLRRQPAPSLSPEREAAMMARIDASIGQPGRVAGGRAFLQRRVMVPAIGLATLVVVVLTTINFPERSTEKRDMKPAAAPASVEAPRQTRRMPRRLQAPEIPATSSPAVDSTLPQFHLPPAPRVDTGTPEVTPGPGPRYPVPSPGPRR